MEKVKVGVIGVGALGSCHARIYSKLPNVELVGVADIDIAKAKDIGLLYDTTYTKDYRELLDKIDAASIVVPTEKHFDIAKDALNKNIHTLVEKPFTKTLQQADEITSLAESKNLILQVGHVERFNSAIRAIKKVCKIPRFIECHRLGPFKTRSLDIGVVLDLMIHDIDIILDLVNSEIEYIDAVGANILTPHEDIANARIKFKNKTVCDITVSRVTEDVQRKIRIFQDDAYISIDYVAQQAKIYTKKGKIITKKELKIEKEMPLEEEIKSFIKCVEDNKKPLVSAREGRAALEVAFRIIEEIERNR